MSANRIARWTGTMARVLGVIAGARPRPRGSSCPGRRRRRRERTRIEHRRRRAVPGVRRHDHLVAEAQPAARSAIVIATVPFATAAPVAPPRA